MKSLIRGFSTLWNGTDRVDLECEMAWDLGFYGIGIKASFILVMLLVTYMACLRYGIWLVFAGFCRI